MYKDYTDGFCSGGACDTSVTPEFQEDCDSYDSYGDNYCINSTVFRNYNDYSCSSGACSYTPIMQFVEECANGCTDGSCDLVADSCSETDAGFDPNSAGTASGYLNEVFYSMSDYCLDNNILREYYCSGTSADSTQVPCSFFNATMCVSGECI